MVDPQISPVSTDAPEYIDFVLMRERVANEATPPVDPEAAKKAMKLAMRTWILDSYAACMLSKAGDQRR